MTIRHGGQSGINVVNRNPARPGSTPATSSVAIPRPPEDQVSILLAKVQALEKKIREHEFHSHKYIPDHTHTPAPKEKKTQNNNNPVHSHTPPLPSVGVVNRVRDSSTFLPPVKVASKPLAIASTSQINPPFVSIRKPGGTAVSLGGPFDFYSPTPMPLPTTTHYIPTIPYQPVQIPPHLSSSHPDMGHEKPRRGPLHPPPALAPPMIPAPPQVLPPSIPPPTRHDHQPQHVPVMQQQIEPVAHAPIHPPAKPVGHQAPIAMVRQPVEPIVQNTAPPVVQNPTPSAPPLPPVPDTWAPAPTDAPLPPTVPQVILAETTNNNVHKKSTTTHVASTNNAKPTTVNNDPLPSQPPTEEPAGGAKRTEWNNNSSGQGKAANLENPPTNKPSTENNQSPTQLPTGEFEGSQAREMVVDQLTGMIAGNQNTSNAERNMVRDFLSGIEELPALFLGLTWAERQNVMRQQTAQPLNTNTDPSLTGQSSQRTFYRGDPFAASVFDPFYVDTTNNPWGQRSPFTAGWW